MSEPISKERESELLAIWQKNNLGVKRQIEMLEQEYIEAKEILDNWQNKDHPLYERHTSCVDGIQTRLEALRQELKALEN